MTFAATVKGNDGTPTGIVALTDGATTLGTASLDDSGQATFITSTLTVGSHSITANYGGDPNFLGSRSMLTQAVDPKTQAVNPKTRRQLRPTDRYRRLYGPEHSTGH